MSSAGVQVTPSEETSTGSAQVPFAASSVSLARHAFLDDVAGALPPSVCDDAVLVLSELVSNSLRHARALPDGTLRVTWRRTGERVEVSVTDGGASTRPLVREPSLSALGGRGMAIVGTITQDWGVRDGGGDVTVWARLGHEQGPTEVKGRG